MKFQKKMILGYALVAGISAFITGLFMYKLNVTHTMENEISNLNIVSEQIANQMDDRFAQMDASMSYILSDPNLLYSISVLGMDNSKTAIRGYKVEAEQTLRRGINTDYITKYCYRTVFFNKSGKIISSADSSFSRIRSSFKIQSMPWLSLADQAKGKSVIVNTHEDSWTDSKNIKKVYSLIKAIQGDNMGYLEVQNTTDELNNLNVSDKDVTFLIYANGDELLYSSNFSQDPAKYLPYLKEEQNSDDDKLVSKYESDKYDFTVLAIKSKTRTAEQNAYIWRYPFIIASVIFLTSLIFVVLWSYILVKPIREMRKIVERTDLKNLKNTENVQLEGTNDEIQTLYKEYQLMTERLNKAVIRERKASLLQLQSLFDSLQAQVNPHFIFNVLNIISARGFDNDDDVICEMCGALASMLRYSTGNKERYTKVENELEYLQNYYYLLRARYEDKIEFNFDVDAEVRKQIIPKVTLQQILENSVNHGFKNLSEPMRIEIIGRMEQKQWFIRIRDNGEGFGTDALRQIEIKIEEIHKKILDDNDTIEMEIGGMGLVNVYARCLLLYGDNLIFKLENIAEEAGAEVIVGARFSGEEI